MSQSVPSKSLGKICKEIYRYPTYYGITYVEEGIPEVRGELILDNGEIEADQTQWRFIDKVTAAKFPRTALEVNDLVMSVRGTIGKIGLIPTSLHGANITANLIRISPYREVVEPRFLWHFMRTKRFQMDLNHVSPSTTIKTIRAPDLKAIPIPLPPLEEQRRIAAILDKADAVCRKRQSAIALTEELLRSAFLEMFGDPVTNPKGWEICTVGQCLQNQALLEIQDGNHGEIHPKVSDFVKSGIPFVAANALAGNRLELSKCPCITIEQAKSLRVGFSRGDDVLLTHKGSIGFSDVVPSNVELIVLTPQTTYYRTNPKKLRSAYLATYFQTQYFQNNLEQISHQSTRAYVGITRQRNLPLMLPSIALQNHFEQVRTQSKNTECRYKEMAKQADNLFNSLLQKAFRGEL